MNTSKSPSFARALVMTAVLVASSTAWSASSIKEIMKNEIGPAFKVIYTDLKARTIGPKTQAAGKSLLHGLTELQNQAPEFVPDANSKDGARAITAAEVSSFKEQSRQTLAFGVLLDRALSSSGGEIPEVWKTFAAELVKAKIEATERPAPANLDNVVVAAEILKVMSAERKTAHDQYKPEQ